MSGTRIEAFAPRAFLEAEVRGMAVARTTSDPGRRDNVGRAALAQRALERVEQAHRAVLIRQKMLGVGKVFADRRHPPFPWVKGNHAPGRRFGHFTSSSGLNRFG